MQLPIGAALSSAGRFMISKPLTAFTLARHAMAMRIAVPLDVFRWLVGQLGGGKGPQDVAIAARPPALCVGATMNVMKTTVRAEVALTFNRLEFGPDSLRVTIGLSDLNLELVGDADTPVAGLLKSGALDLSKPGNLVNMMPKRPPALVSATEDSIVLDFFEVPALAANPTINKVLRTVTPVANIDSIATDDDMLLIGFRVTPTGIPAAIAAARL
ncbi:MAG: hypothetical protein KC503_14655 [Myxococcales bacterium]|nr:hypothetical protein [Myxococcales bacterium]